MKTQIIPSCYTQWLGDHSNLQPSYVSQQGVVKGQKILLDKVNQEWLGGQEWLEQRRGYPGVTMCKEYLVVN